MYATKFDGLKTLIELHWLEGLPLWACVAARQETKGEASDGVVHVSEEADEFHALHGPASLDNLTNWIYCVRQVVALSRTNNTAWQRVSLQYFQRYEPYQSNGSFLDSELVGVVIDAMGEAMKYGVGYKSKDKKDYFRFRSGFRKFAGKKENMKVALLYDYCVEVGKLLREDLADGYAEWEKNEDENFVPRGLLLDDEGEEKEAW
jgi:hypothetical protein